MRRKRRGRTEDRGVRGFICETGRYFRKATERNLDGKIDEKKKGRREEEGGTVEDIELGIRCFLLPCLSCCCCVPSRGVYLRYLGSK